MNIVLDTNVVISAALSPQGNPAQLIKIIRDNEYIQLYLNSVILTEYRKVFSYERLHIPTDEQQKALEALQKIGVSIDPVKSDIALPDESDRIFYDTAKASNAFLITGNMKHYPSEPFIVTPAQFVCLLETE